MKKWSILNFSRHSLKHELPLGFLINQAIDLRNEELERMTSGIKNKTKCESEVGGFRSIPHNQTGSSSPCWHQIGMREQTVVRAGCGAKSSATEHLCDDGEGETTFGSVGRCAGSAILSRRTPVSDKYAYVPW
jgi:hypothetical protein